MAKKKTAKKKAKTAKKTVKKKTKTAKKTAKKKTKTTKKTTKKKTKAVKKTAKKKTKAAKKTAKKKTTKPSQTPKQKKPINKEIFNKKVKSDIKNAITADIKTSKGEISLDDLYQQIKHIEFFISKSDECLERNCDNPATTWGYCRLHYIGKWPEIKKKQALLGKGKLQSYVMSLIEKYPSKYIRNILADLSEEKSFFNTLKELGIEEIEDFDDLVDDESDDDQDIAYETKVTAKPNIDE